MVLFFVFIFEDLFVLECFNIFRGVVKYIVINVEMIKMKKDVEIVIIFVM